MTPRHFIDDLDLTTEEQAQLIADACEMKANPGAYRTTLACKILGMIFTKSSTRTRVSFESGIIQLGGNGIFLASAATQVGRGEPISDTGQVLSRYLDIIMIRTFSHDDVRDLAAAATVPVINGLDDVYHPCQILADLMTIHEAKGELRGQQLVFVGDGNNVANSLLLGGARAGVHVRVVAPVGWQPQADIVDRARGVGKQTGASIEVTADLAGVEGADVVYTDVWTSMGQEAEAAKRKAAFAGYQVDARLMKRAKPDATFLHCLPAHRGEEVSAEVIDGPQSRVFDQAENRLHAQKALMVRLLAAS